MRIASNFPILVVVANVGSAIGLAQPKPVGEPLHGQNNVLSEMIARARTSKTTIPLIGVHDSISARIVARQQHQQPDRDIALFVSGFGVSATRLGQPDAGILTRSDMEDATRNIIASVPRRTIPVIVDGDTGYGGSPNVRQTIRRVAALGAAAITIEDQVFPKRCTYVAGRGVNVVERHEAVQRVNAALAAREEAWERDGNPMMVIARTDCRMATSFHEALERCLIFQEIDADIVYAENLQSIDEYVKLREHISKPMMLAQVQTGSNTEMLLSMKDVGDMGYELALWGVSGLQAAVAAMDLAVAELLMEDKAAVSSTVLASLGDVKDLVGFEDLDNFESMYPCS
jgi:2-methylisocitrate lyase-like PEP mutase family enzyme